MENDPLVTSFGTTVDQFHINRDYGSDVDVDQVATEPNTQKSRSTDYGSDADFSWSSSAFGTLNISKVESSVDPERVATISNYGSDLDSDDERVIAALLDDAEEIAANPEFEAILHEDAIQPVVRIPRILSSQKSGQSGSSRYYSCAEDIDNSGNSVRPEPLHSYYSIAKATENAKGLLNDVEISVEQESEVARSTSAVHGSLDVEQLSSEGLNDRTGLSPLERWRNSRPLAVSDFTSPAWCELQYFFSLSKYGRIQRTAPMKRGSEVHRKLEEEIHDYKPVEVQTREDSWGLRIWNVIQGLRTLRYMGVTRELDVWGVIDGQVVAGIIDELSIQCPDSEFEEKLEVKESPDIPLPSAQQTITEFFATRSASERPKQTPPQDIPAKIYITDTKTRTTPTVPNGSSLRPVRIQLMIYHHLIMQLSTKSVPSASIFARYKLRPLAPFSNTFMAEMSAVEFNISAQDSHFSSPSSVHSELQNHPNLESLWNLMLSEFAETFPPGALSPLLHASFRSQADGTLLGGRSFVNDDSDLQAYVSDEMDWWKGARQARGVEVNEAFKCRICEFAEGCQWRKEKEKELTTGRDTRRGGKARDS